MTALAETQARIDSVRKLRTVVGAMRGIAATHTQQARAALPGYRAYAEVIAGGLARAAELVEPSAQPEPARAAAGAAIVAFGAEHGFAGAFSERVLDGLDHRAGDRLFIAGARTLVLAEQRTLKTDWEGPMASQASGVGATARRLADALYSGFVAGRFSRADICFAKLTGLSDFTVVRRGVLPIDLSAFRRPRSGPAPLANLPPRRLVEQLMGEYVFAELALAALESFASENAVRLATMESARLNIDQTLDELSGQERLLRQEQITAEVQDVTAGALAAAASRDRRPDLGRSARKGGDLSRRTG